MRIGRRVDAAALPAVREAAFIGAENPMGRRHPPGWNARRTAVLEGWLRRVPHVAGRGQGRGWSESHVLAALPAARAAVLARRFRQLAIVVVRPGQPARLLPVRP